MARIGNPVSFSKHFGIYIYVVYDLNEAPKLVIPDKAFIEQEGKERVSIEVPLRKAQYEAQVTL